MTKKLDKISNLVASEESTYLFSHQEIKENQLNSLGKTKH